MDDILVPVSPGELIDKLTILRIKTERISDPDKLLNVRREKDALDAVVAAQIPMTAELETLWQRLYAINCDLWVIEDDIREMERKRDFGAGFVGLARSVYMTNDRRADVKKQINRLLGSDLVEEKSYADYGAGSEKEADT